MTIPFTRPLKAWRHYAIWHGAEPWGEGELIATAVSRINLSPYCVSVHRSHAVGQLSEEEVAQALDDGQCRSLAPVRSALLQFAEQLTVTPEEFSHEHVGRAVEVGARLDRLRSVVEIAAAANVANRISTASERGRLGLRPPRPNARNHPPGVEDRDRSFFVEPVQVWQATLHSCLRWDARELIATAVSRANVAPSCVAFHRPRAVARLSEEQVRQALDEPGCGSLPPVRRALLEFAERLTLAPEEMSCEDVNRAVEAGASIDRLKDLVEIAALTNMMNRISTAVGAPADGRGPRSPQPRHEASFLPGAQGQDRDFFKGSFLAWQRALPLSYRSWEERELIATAVSQANQALRWVASHRPRAVAWLSEEVVGQVLDDTERASLPPVRRALVEFAEQLTLTPENISSENVGRAIDAGASIERLQDVVETAARMNVMNRVAATMEHGK